MKIFLRLLTLMLVLIMLVQSMVVSTFAIAHIEVDTGVYQAATGYDDASDVKYVKVGDYIANWGAREEDATFLSTYAENFYTGNYTYDVVSKKAGGTSQSNAHRSALYTTLKNLMSSKQSYVTSYDATRSLFQYTDCEKNGNKISSFYSGKSIGPSWDSGATWNREHTWPNSKGSGDAENDIMMLRPTSTSENSSRGNTAYGKSSGYYFPNSESNGKYDLRGDVARICLYVYVRWGNTSYMWGKSGVMESLTVLLEWMEEDPVDTWEMGRNDAVQSITGTRNVFVDYPEYAWLLFGQSVPAGYVTPSSGSHSWDAGKTTKEATCTTDGAKLYTCKDSGCGETKTVIIPATGHTGTWKVDVQATETTNGSKSRTCTTCGTKETEVIPATGLNSDGLKLVTSPVVGVPYKFGMTRDNTTYYINGSMNSYYFATTTNPDDALDVYLEETSGRYYLYYMKGATKTYLNILKTTDNHYNATYSSTDKSVFVYNSTYNTFATTIDSKQYCFGTQKSGTYTTLAGRELSANEYVAQLFAEVTSDTPSTPDDPEIPDNPTPDNPSLDYTTSAEFIEAVNAIDTLKGKERFEAIKEAVDIYNKLSAEDKGAISVLAKFNTLKTLINDYNTDIESANNAASNLTYALAGIEMFSASLVPFAAYSLLKKKYF